MFDPKKPVMTRDGRKARILCVDACLYEKKFIVALVKACFADENEYVTLFHENGLYNGSSESDLDLVNIPEVTFKFINIYHDSSTIYTHSSCDSAYKGAVRPTKSILRPSFSKSFCMMVFV